MITLITGAPGSGKTLYCVDKIIRKSVGQKIHIDAHDGDDAQTVEREIYTNINGLLLDHHLIDNEWLAGLHENRKIGSLVVFDEVQRVWPNRVANSKKPEAVEYLETHRHDGLDIVLLTQSPLLLDPSVRALVGRHLHIRRVGGMGAAVVYEWDAVSNQLRYKAAFTKTPYKYDKGVFKLYKSARVHTKQKRSLPSSLYFVLAGLLALGFVSPRIYNMITKERQAITEKLDVSGSLDFDSNAARLKKIREVAESSKIVRDVVHFPENHYHKQFIPRDPGLPYSAPRYDDITRPVVAPVPAACLATAERCTCFTQQATPITMSYSQCVRIVEHGHFIDFDTSGGRDEQKPVNLVQMPG